MSAAWKAILGHSWSKAWSSGLRTNRGGIRGQKISGLGAPAELLRSKPDNGGKLLVPKSAQPFRKLVAIGHLFENL